MKLVPCTDAAFYLDDDPKGNVQLTIVAGGCELSVHLFPSEAAALRAAFPGPAAFEVINPGGYTRAGHESVEHVPPRVEAEPYPPSWRKGLL